MSKKTTLNTVQKESILSKYGGEEHLSAPPKELLMGAQTEEYTEYSQSGQVIVGREKIAVRSIYEEDKFPMNHTAIWGSFWKDGEWGYKCCHSAIRNSYCAGEAGKAALKASEDLLKNPRVVERKVVEEKIDKGKSKAEEVNMEQLKGGVTEKEMEEYHRNKSSYDDPMKNYL
jgi:pre-mRNA-processing factor SLU7